MGRETKIPWCHHTFNGVRGCEHATLADGTESPGCKHCYAETMSKRNPAQLGVWGEEGTRILGGLDYWASLDKWHRSAVRDGVLRRVFCYSLADVFESPKKLANADVCAKGRALLWDAIERLRAERQYDLLSGDRVGRLAGLIFLLLTKRPENMKRMVPATWLKAWPQHVWLGTSVENQQAADERIPHLLAVPGVPVRFLSLEPLLERIDLRRWLEVIDMDLTGLEDDYLAAHLLQRAVCEGRADAPRRIGWLIAGGESGHHARPCDLAWIRDIRDQGTAAGVHVFVKQLGASPIETFPDQPNRSRYRWIPKHPKGEDPSEWPEDLRVREVPAA